MLLIEIIILCIEKRIFVRCDGNVMPECIRDMLIKQFDSCIEQFIDIEAGVFIPMDIPLNQANIRSGARWIATNVDSENSGCNE